MSAGHAHHLHIEVDSPVHRLPPQVKIVALVVFVVAVVATPRESFMAFAGYALAEFAVVAIALIPFGTFARRTLVVLPFVAFAALLPFVGSDPTVRVAGSELSVEGLWAAWAITAKAWLGAGASVLLASCTPVPELLAGFDTLRVPRAITAVAGFMVRYLNVIADDLRRSRMAMTARGYRPRWFWQALPLARLAGTMFVRSYERGERVFTAMLARGFTGTMPQFGRRPAGAADWFGGLAVPVAAVCVAAAIVVVR